MDMYTPSLRKSDPGRSTAGQIINCSALQPCSKGVNCVLYQACFLHRLQDELERTAGETPQLVKTEPIDFGDLDSFFERGAEAQLEADNAHYRPIIGALKAEIERLQVLQNELERTAGVLAVSNKPHAGIR